MLSDEEKAKDILINFRKYNKYYKEGKALSITISFELKEALNEAIRVLLTVYEKQSKEIEDLKEIIKTFKIEDENIYLQFGEITEKKRWEDKIKAKIEDLKLECENCPYKGELCDELNSNNNCVPGMSILILISLLEKE